MSREAYLRRRVLLHVVVLIICAFIFIGGPQSSSWLPAPLLLWGAWAFRTITEASTLGPLKIQVGFVGYIVIWIVGAILLAVFAPFVVPIILARDLIELSRS